MTAYKYKFCIKSINSMGTPYRMKLSTVGMLLLMPVASEPADAPAETKNHPVSRGGLSYLCRTYYSRTIKNDLSR
jgi:hypothetical protein